MTDRHTITNIHWQIKLAHSADNGPVSIATDYADIEQEIRIIVMTPIGSVPTNPLKGCDLMPLIDLPGEIASPLVCQAVFDAINIWVSRVEVGTVTATAIAAHHWVVHIPWRVKDDVLADFRLLEMDLQPNRQFASATARRPQAAPAQARPRERKETGGQSYAL